MCVFAILQQYGEGWIREKGSTHSYWIAVCLLCAAHQLFPLCAASQALQSAISAGESRSEVVEMQAQLI